MSKPVDISKFRKGITKSIPGISTGFNDPQIWLDTGSYALNFLVTGHFDRGIPLEGKMTQFAGSAGSGKSYIASANLVKDAQKKGVFPVIIDSENALDEAWLQALGVDTADDAMMIVRMSMIDEVAKFLNEFIKDYKDTYKGVERDERPAVLFVIDSLGMMLTPTNVKQFEQGDMKGDMGIKAKQITALVRNAVSLMASERMGMAVTNHVYDSQDMFKPDSVITGGKGLEYASSVIIVVEKLKLKEDADGNKTSEVHGIRASTVVRKSRYSKPFEKIEIQIPWDGGMDPYSGLFDLFMKKGLLVKEGNRYKYICKDGTEIKEFRKNLTTDHFDRMMLEYEEPEATAEEFNEFIEDSGEDAGEDE